MMGNYLSCMLFLFLPAAFQPPGNKLQISELVIRGNKITRENIILRELAFQKGDTILLSEIDEKIKRSRENLLNTSLFNYVTITSEKTEAGNVSVDILVEKA